MMLEGLYIDGNGVRIPAPVQVTSDGKVVVEATAVATVMGASGASHASGFTPDTPAQAGSVKYLREDGTWALPPDIHASVMVASGATGHAGGLVPDPGGATGTTKFLREDASWATPPDTNTTYSTFVACGASAAEGLVPSPGATPGVTRFLREDASFQEPMAILFSQSTTNRQNSQPYQGKVVYDLTINKITFYNGSAWEIVASVVEGAG